jgi:hypothetical protein
MCSGAKQCKKSHSTGTHLIQDYMVVRILKAADIMKKTEEINLLGTSWQ